MQTSQPPLDLRKSAPAELPELLRQRAGLLGAEEALVVQARHPLAEAVESLGPGWASWPLIDGPSAWYVLLYRARPLERRLDPVRERYRQLPVLYHRAVRQALARDPEALATGRRFRELLHQHLELKQTRLYPLYRRVVGEDRLPRELGYEIDGIRQGLGRWEDMLRGALEGSATRRQLDRFEIDFFHLIEHHIEREKLSLLPALELLGGSELLACCDGLSAEHP
ncbi:MAG: hemerythrin domain-containing protein [Armatimonadetes bacterium]|nr:hemerythrin domain-containing protein [Armatimonadota bacterium]